MKVKITMLKNKESKVKAFASIELELKKGSLFINSLKVIEDGDGGYFVAMPSASKEIDGETKYFNTVYAEKELMDVIEQAVLKEFKKTKPTKTPKSTSIPKESPDDDIPF